MVCKLVAGPGFRPGLAMLGTGRKLRGDGLICNSGAAGGMLLVMVAKLHGSCSKGLPDLKCIQRAMIPFSLLPSTSPA